MVYRKGQAALEFLTTYGWVFLAVALTFGALTYFNVFDSADNFGGSCKFGDFVGCPTVAVEQVTEDSFTVDMNLVNSKDIPFEVEQLKIRVNGREEYCTASHYTDIEGHELNGKINSFGGNKNFRFVLIDGTNCDFEKAGFTELNPNKELFDILLIYDEGEQDDLYLSTSGAMRIVPVIPKTLNPTLTCEAFVGCDSVCGGVGSGYSNNLGATCYSDASCSSVCGPVNNPPEYVELLGPTTIMNYSGSMFAFQLSFGASDAEDPFESLAFSFDDSLTSTSILDNCAILSPEYAWCNVTGEGITNITRVVTDTGGLQGFETFRIQVNPNGLPTVNPISVAVDLATETSFSENATNYVIDDALEETPCTSYTLSGIDTGYLQNCQVSDSGNECTLSCDTLQVGNTSFDLTFEDLRGETATGTVEVEIINSSALPCILDASCDAFCGGAGTGFSQGGATCYDSGSCDVECPPNNPPSFTGPSGWDEPEYWLFHDQYTAINLSEYAVDENISALTFSLNLSRLDNNMLRNCQIVQDEIVQCEIVDKTGSYSYSTTYVDVVATDEVGQSTTKGFMVKVRLNQRPVFGANEYIIPIAEPSFSQDIVTDIICYSDTSSYGHPLGFLEVTDEDNGIIEARLKYLKSTIDHYYIRSCAGHEAHSTCGYRLGCTFRTPGETSYQITYTDDFGKTGIGTVNTTLTGTPYVHNPTPPYSSDSMFLPMSFQVNFTEEEFRFNLSEYVNHATYNYDDFTFYAYRTDSLYFTQALIDGLEPEFFKADLLYTGNTSFNIKATDPLGNEYYGLVELEIIDDRLMTPAPQITFSSPAILAEDSGLQTIYDLTSIVSDADTDFDDLVFMLSDPIRFTRHYNPRPLCEIVGTEIKCIANSYGMAEYNLTVIDGYNVETQPFRVNVLGSYNHRPILTIPEIKYSYYYFIEGQLFDLASGQTTFEVFDLDEYDYDLELDTVQYSLDESNLPPYADCFMDGSKVMCTFSDYDNVGPCADLTDCDVSLPPTYPHRTIPHLVMQVSDSQSAGYRNYPVSVRAIDSRY